MVTHCHWVLPWLTVAAILTLVAGVATVEQPSIHGSPLMEIGRCHVSQFMEHSASWDSTSGSHGLEPPLEQVHTDRLEQLLLHHCSYSCHWAYGQGVNKAWREIRRTGGAAGVGRQIDDRERTL